MGSVVISKVPIGPERKAVPVKFGQSNPFDLPKAVVPDQVVDNVEIPSPSTGGRQAGQLSCGTLTHAVEPASTTVPPLSSAVLSSNVIPVAPDSEIVRAVLPDPSSSPAPGTLSRDVDYEKSLVPGTPQRLQEVIFHFGGEGTLPLSKGETHTSQAEESTADESTPGLKRKPDKVRNRKKKLSRQKREGAVDTFLLDSSSSGSDRTVIVSDSQEEVMNEEEGDAQEVPPTDQPPLAITCGPDSLKPGDPFPPAKASYESIHCGPDSIKPGDPYSKAEYSYETTGICPWIHKLTDEFFKFYPEPMDRLKNMHRFMRVISEVFVNISARLEQLDSIKQRLETLEAAQAKPSFSQVVGAPLFSVGISNPGVTLPETLTERRPPRVRNKRSRTSLASERENVPPRDVSTTPLVQTQHRVPVTQQFTGPDQGKAQFKPSLKPRPDSPTVLVSPLGDALNSSTELKSLLEAHISPRQLGLRVLACLPAADNGVMVKLHTAEMATILENHINAHPDLNGVCRARAPRRLQPKILLYDVPPMPGNREEQERSFLEKIRISNSFPEGSVSVLFRRSCRGAAQHWVLSLDPVVFHCISGTNRLHWGLGSLKFRPFSEPIQCFRCLKFGHVQSRCRAPEEHCSRCLGSHSYKNCTAAASSCRNCHEYNRRNRVGPRLKVTHTAVSRHCPIFFRACEELRLRLPTVL
ncbi:hypothetical protein AVEN_42078-1 [Araneus ventricosus]|uniref:CCHC-type domain-containing protein n=1 Tax=Araneus ventricosus TaxID=182803 RepID=A0A4Y2V5H6_ARAVE|nr:hypothetical protein AVEN_201389-1 [Araneus ventricosus]GBO19801.1 hypothetical protein AVEN_121518-1 [Araneus ventricosus]GBO22130.1 hypothetical protein AVEN_218927-1 [Araneus ventricosus]GBO22171.1 hypothetical protein AVEN_42078-1 [Araneus ventricosus]